MVNWPEIKLYLDEDVSPNLVEMIRQRGYDVVSTHEIGNCGNSDEKQLEFASSQCRAILTFNISDYAKLHQKWLAENKIHYGIIVSQQFSKREIGELLRRVLRFLNTYTADEVYNNFLYLGR